MPRMKCANYKEVPNMGAVPFGYIDNHMFDRYRANMSMMRIVYAGESNVVWGSRRCMCNVNCTFENNILDIFHGLYWYSEPMGNKCMTKTRNVEK